MKHQSLWTILAVVLISILIVTGTTAQDDRTRDTDNVHAQVGHAFSYQGRLENNAAIVNSTCDFQFRLFNAANNGTQIGSLQTSTNVSVNDGYFTVMLDFGANAFTGEARWLDIQVRCPGGSGTYTQLTPRQELAPAPYAMGLMPGVNVTAELTSRSIILAENTATSQGDTNGIAGLTSSPQGAGVAAWNKSLTSGFGVWGGIDGTEGNGIYGVNRASTGYGAGILGESYSSSGSGSAGRNFSPTGGNGVYGESHSPNGYGVYGTVLTTTAQSNSAVYGINNATAGSGDGVVGITYSPDAAGLVGYNNATAGGYGLWAGINAADGVGIYGENFATTGPANAIKGVSSVGSSVVGWNEGTGTGVQAFSLNGTGLVAESKNGNPIEAYGSSISDLEFYVSNTGDVYADGTFHTPAADFAEMLPAQEGLEPGDVLVIGADGKLALCTTAYATSVAGVYSTQPGFVGGMPEVGVTNEIPLAILGIVPVKVSAENGAIQPGDLLVTANTPGHAMRASAIEIDGFSFFPSGVILGKALESLEEGTGVIQILVTLQ